MRRIARRWRTLLAATCTALTGIWACHEATYGLQAFTLESARRLQALRSPAPVPLTPLELADGRRIGVDAIAAPVLLVDFIYTRCESYCSALGGVFAQLQERLVAEIAAGEVRLVSISFDPRHDTPAALSAYRERHRGEPRSWLLGRPAQPAQLERWLDGFGVVVIGDGLGGYVHNAAVHVVNADRKLVGIHDPAAIDAVVAYARALAGGTQRGASER